MGFFSWKASDTGRSIPNCHSIRDTFPVTLLSPDGENFTEKNYDGHGVFSGKDVYEWVVEYNAPELLFDKEGNRLPTDIVRRIGIEFAASDEDNAKLEFPIKIVEDSGLEYRKVEPSKSCPDQGFFYPEMDEIDEW